MSREPFVRWTDISAEKTSLPGLIQLLNRRLGRGAAGDVALVQAHFDSGSSTVAISAGTKLDMPFPRFQATIVGWQAKIYPIDGQTVGSIQWDIWKKAYGKGLATVADTIITIGKPAITAAVENRALAVKGWAQKIEIADVLTYNVDSVTNCRLATLTLAVIRG